MFNGLLQQVQRNGGKALGIAHPQSAAFRMADAFRDSQGKTPGQAIANVGGAFFGFDQGAIPHRPIDLALGTDEDLQRQKKGALQAFYEMVNNR